MLELEKEKYHLLKNKLTGVEVNTLFAQFVIERKVEGRIFVDNSISPETFYVVHPYGMSLLFGKHDNDEFNKRFVNYCFNSYKTRNSFEWMQAYPRTWDHTLVGLFGSRLIKATEATQITDDKIEQDVRVNFVFNKEKYQEFKKNYIKEEHQIRRTDKQSCQEMKGAVVPSKFWNNTEDFCSNGVGFSLFSNNKLATTAYSAFIVGNKLELGMETFPDYRGKGFAQYACAALIDYCIDNNYEPIWACKLSNIPSYKLAQKLGFEPGLTLPYYRLAL